MAHGKRGQALFWRPFSHPTKLSHNDYLTDAAKTPLIGSVHVQVGVSNEQALDETKWLQSIATTPLDSTDDRNLPSAIVAHVDLSSPSAADNITARKAYPNFRGARQIIGRSYKEDAKTGTDSLLDDPQWKEGLSLLARSNLSFDLQLIPS